MNLEIHHLLLLNLTLNRLLIIFLLRLTNSKGKVSAQNQRYIKTQLSLFPSRRVECQATTTETAAAELA